MKKSINIILASILSLSFLSSCTKKAVVPETPTTSAPTTEATATTEPKTDTNGQKTLTVYSPHPAEVLSIGAKAFEEKTGVKVDIVAAGTGELLKRIESESANPLGDVMWGGGAESLKSFSKHFESYKPVGIESIPSSFYDADFNWIGESPLPMIIMYNTDLVPEGSAPKSWQDLLKPEFKGKIAYADPAKSGSAYTILATMLTAYGVDDTGWKFIEDFYANLDGKVLGSSSGVYKGVADGEYSVGLTLEKEAIKYVVSGAKVAIVYPSEGTTAVPDGVAIIKGTKNIDNAKLFLDFVISKEFQEKLVVDISRRSVRDDVASPEGLSLMSEIKLVDYDFDWAAGSKEEVLAKWKDIVVGR